MARSFLSIINSIARSSAKAQREAEREQRRLVALAKKGARERERQMKFAAKEAAQAQKEAKQKYLEDRANEVEELNFSLREKIEELSEILAHTLKINDTIDFDSLKIKNNFHSFAPIPQLRDEILPPDREVFFEHIEPLNWFYSLFFWCRNSHAKAMEEAEKEYQKTVEERKKLETERQIKLQAAQKKYDQEKEAFLAKLQQRNHEVEALENAYKAGEPEGVITYCTMVLERSEYSSDFPQEFRIAYVPESKEVVIEYELPTAEIIPTILEYKYVKTKDINEEKPRKPAEIKELYQDLIAAITLRTIHEIFESDQGNHIETVVFNGFVSTIDPATGRDIRPCLISTRATKAKFLEIDLSRVNKLVCLRNLGAQVSPRASEVQPVKPIVEFDMVDKRFVEESDVLSDLDSRPNLMDLNPFEFENLVCNMFKQMGLETKLTRSSRDGGVDVVAFDVRPVLGGKVVIQAKRYKNTVGVSAVRDLYGTMMNEGANKGILVSTSGYGPDAFDFSKDKPIELIDGGQLLFLLQQIGTTAKIIMPEDN